MTETNGAPERDDAWKHRQLTYGVCNVCGEARDLRQFTDDEGKPRVELYQPCGHSNEEHEAAAGS